MSQINELNSDLQMVSDSSRTASTLLAKGWLKLPEKYEDIDEFLKGLDTDSPQIAAILTLINYGVTKDRLLRKPLREGDYVEVLKNGDWEPGKVNSTSPGGMVNVDTEKGPVTAYQGKSRTRLPR